MSSDRERQREAFGRRMGDVLNMGALNLAMGIGYRLGLFDALDDLGRAVGAERLADAAGLDARYVREWLGVMVCGDVVELTVSDDGRERFRLPAAHGDLLARRAGPENMGVYTQEIPLLTRGAFDSILEAFASGEGVGYEHYPRFQRFMAQLADAKHRRALVDAFLPAVEDGRLVADLQRGIRVCDLGCGGGTAVTTLAAAFPDSRFTGIDISRRAVDRARAAAAAEGLKNTAFLRRDAAGLAADNQLRGTFDYVLAFDAIHDQTRPAAALAGVFALLRPGGRFSMVDIAADSRLSANRDHPMGAFLYTVSLMHCLPVGRVDGGAGLGMMWGRQRAVEMMQAAGFAEVAVLPIPGDPFNLHFLGRRPG